MDEKVRRLIDRCMTVGDLLDMLRECDPEMPVAFACNYGDYHNTQQVLPAASADVYQTSALAESGYSLSGVELLDDGSEDDDDSVDVLIIQ